MILSTSSDGRIKELLQLEELKNNGITPCLRLRLCVTSVITTGTIFSRLNVLSLLLYTSKKPLSNGDARVCTLVQPTDVVVCKHDACAFPTVTMHDGNERDMVADQNPQFMGSFPDT
jgi:hypothetical protein